MKPWNEAAADTRRQVQRGELETMLTAKKGNIKQSAKALSISRQHATRLLKEFDLKKFAADLRLKAGAVRDSDGLVRGRPKKKKTGERPQPIKEGPE